MTEKIGILVKVQNGLRFFADVALTAHGLALCGWGITRISIVIEKP